MNRPNNYGVNIPDGEYAGACMEIAGIESCGLGMQPSPVSSSFGSDGDAESSEDVD